jgi:hypothetical protein
MIVVGLNFSPTNQLDGKSLYGLGKKTGIETVYAVQDTGMILNIIR